MFCEKCGCQMEDGTRFCPNCGNAVAETEPTHTDTVTEFDPNRAEFDPNRASFAANTAQYDEGARQSAASGILTMGILGIIFCQLFLGIIFSAIGKKRAAAYELAYGVLSGKAKVGFIMSKVSFIVSIVFTIFWALYIIMIVGIMSAAM